MSDVIDSETIDTPAGEYVISVHYDDSPDNPLASWDHPGMAFYVSGDRSITTDSLDVAGDAGRALSHFYRNASEYRYRVDMDDVERRYTMWRVFSGSPWALVTGEDSASRSDSYHWLVLVDTTEWPVDEPDAPTHAATATMETYRAWAAGEVYGYTVTGPDGSDVEDGSCWGFYGDDRDGYMMDEARGAIDYDVTERTKAASLVGAGFIGVI